MRFRHLAMIPYFVVSATACSAAVEPSGPGDPAQSANGETTERTGEALSPACQGARIFKQSLKNFGLGVCGVFAVGWCFNGGDQVDVELHDDTTGQFVPLQASTGFQAGPDTGYVPGAIQGGIVFNCVGNTDHLRLIAIDSPIGLAGLAQSSCFTFNGGC